MISERHCGGPNTRFRRVLPSTILSVLPVGYPILSAMASEPPSAEAKAKYDAAKKELLQALAKKRNADKQLVSFRHLPSCVLGILTGRSLKAQLEVQIYNLETSYLTETAAHSGGNIIHGFEGYLKNQPGGRRKYEVHDSDRIFSTSSLTFKKVYSPLYYNATFF